jgi:hypothetical protein
VNLAAALEQVNCNKLQNFIARRSGFAQFPLVNLRVSGFGPEATDFVACRTSYIFASGLVSGFNVYISVKVKCDHSTS